MKFNKGDLVRIKTPKELEKLGVTVYPNSAVDVYQNSVCEIISVCTETSFKIAPVELCKTQKNPTYRLISDYVWKDIFLDHAITGKEIDDNDFCSVLLEEV